MKNLQQCPHCVMTVSKLDTTCPSCGEAVNLGLPEAASGCYEPEVKNKGLSIDDKESLIVSAIWFLFGFIAGLIF